MDLVERMLSGEEKALARLISLVENESPRVQQIMQEVAPYPGKAYCVGITGPPGVGKSTLVDSLTALLRGRGFSVGIVAVDPSSPFSGGAVLGDRIRMQRHYLDKGVFIRSMATKGNTGGLPRAIGNVVRLLEAFGKDFILVETVGVGQTETDIMKKADTVVVVLVPELGDIIQTMKAGLMEIADILVINKTDRENAGNLMSALMDTFQIMASGGKRQIPVLQTQALHNVGTAELFLEIENHRSYLKETGILEQRRQERRRRAFIEAIQQKFVSLVMELLSSDAQLTSYLREVEEGKADPYSSCIKVLRSPQFLNSCISVLGNMPDRKEINGQS